MVTGNKVTNYDAWRNLEARYGLESRGQTVKSFADIIVPVANVDAALARDEIQTGLEDIQASPDFVPYFTVPDGEEWAVWMVQKPLTTAASEVQIAGRQRSGEFGTFGISSRDVNAAFLRYDHLTLFGGGGRIGMRSTGNAGDSARVLVIYYQRFLVTQ